MKNNLFCGHLMDTDGTYIIEECMFNFCCWSENVVGEESINIFMNSLNLKRCHE